jgi:branched-chain amino acid transport system ATP-binding protein
MLELQNLHAAYGPTPVLHGVSLSAAPERFLGIIGRNGVGKTTILRSIVGLMPLAKGDVRLDGTSIAGRETHQIARLGVAFVPENRGVFPRLAERRANRGDALSGGEQQMLAIGRALLTNPRLLILDEPTEGLAPLIVLQIRDVLRSLRGSGLAIVIVDQNLETVFDIADDVALISRGTVVAQGTSAAIRGDQALLNHYLGV